MFSPFNFHYDIGFLYLHDVLKFLFAKLVLQILTDAALLKRQQLEIEELRKKLEVIVF
jgi:hypothetical protein